MTDVHDRALVIEAPGIAGVGPVPATDGEILVRTRWSGISPGTELSFLSGTNPGLRSSFDAELGLFRPGRPGTGYPVTRLGYMEVATVAENPSTLSGPPIGALVAMTYACVPRNSAHLEGLVG